MSLNRVTIVIRLERLRRNLRALRLRRPLIMPVVKADAYGHGLERIVKVLVEENVRHIAVGTVGEGLSARKEGYRFFVLALLGASCKEDFAVSAANQITPLIYDNEGLQAIEAQSGFLGDKPTPIAIKVDTGMNRLGFSYEARAALIERLKSSSSVTPAMILSHLSSSDCQEHEAFTNEQTARFKEVYEAMRSVFPDIKPSLMNSPSLLSRPDVIGDMARPGLALYGGNPLYGTSLASLGEEFLPVMEAYALILSVKDVVKGASVGYGRDYVARKDMRIAVVGAGYANGYSRLLSNKAWVLINGERAPIIGRVCMEICMVDITGHKSAQKGDRAYLLGGEGPFAIKAEEIAEWQGVSAYEVFCALGGQNRERNAYEF